MFWSKVAETAATALAALSLAAGSTLTTAGSGTGLEEVSSPALLHAKTANTEQIAAMSIHRIRFNLHHLSCLSVAWMFSGVCANYSTT